MKQREFLRWLIKQSVTTSNGSNHIKLYYKGKQSIMPRHPAKELAIGTVEAIKNSLVLDKKGNICSTLQYSPKKAQVIV